MLDETENLGYKYDYIYKRRERPKMAENERNMREEIERGMCKRQIRETGARNHFLETGMPGHRKRPK